MVVIKVVKCQSCDWQITTISGHVLQAAENHAASHLLLDTDVIFETEDLL